MGGSRPDGAAVGILRLVRQARDRVADVQVRRGLDELRVHTRLDWAPLEAHVVAIRKSIDEWAEALKYVRKQKPTADELASWHAAAAWYAQQEQRPDRER